MRLFILFLKGIIIGMANVIPGVSGGTIAVVFNIYDEFVNAITLNVKKLWANKKFLIPLLGGMALGVLLFSKFVTILYENFPVQTNYAFMGLIIGSIPLIFNYTRKIPQQKKAGPLFVAALVLCAVAGFAVLMLFSYFEGKVDRSAVENAIMPVFTAKLGFKIFFAGILGAITMIIPGISGSLIMLIMGVYTIVITSIPALFHAETFVHALTLLLPNGIGVLTGLLVGAKLISLLLKHIPNHTYAVILGLLVGSAVTICPGFKHIDSIPTALSCLLSLLGGAALAYFSSKSENKSDNGSAVKTEDKTESAQQ